MEQYFSTDVSMMNILFEGWNTDTWKGVFLAFAIIFVMTVMFEGLKVLKLYLIVKREKGILSNENEGDNLGNGIEVNSSEADLLSSLRIPLLNSGQIKFRKASLFVLESLLYIFSFFYSYLLMLLVMTFSVWFLLAVLAGSGAGYFIFNPLGQYICAEYVPSHSRSSTRRYGLEQGTEQTRATHVHSPLQYEGLVSNQPWSSFHSVASPSNSGH